MRTHSWLLLFGMALLALAWDAAGAPGHVLIFKDGFTFAGQVKSPGGFTVDPASHKAMWVTNGKYILDADARRVYFSPQQVQDVLDRDLYQAADIVRLERGLPHGLVKSMYPLTAIIGADPWNEHWERQFKFVNPFGNRVTTPQRLGFLSPFYARVDSKNLNWSAYYMTSEFGPATTRALLDTYPELKKGESTDPAWRFRIYRFLVQAGWYNQAEEELTAILKELPGEKEKVEAGRESLKRLRALQLFDDIERAHQAGQFQWVQEHLGRFPREGVDGKTLAVIRSLKATYETGAENLALARRFLKELPPRCPLAYRPLFQEAAKSILAELDLDNVARLESFLIMARQAERDKKNGKVNKEPEQVLALAVSGWLLGKDAAEAKVEMAQRLWKARRFILQYQCEDDDTERERFLKEYLSFPSDVLPIDELTQVIGFLPPPRAEKDISTEPLSLRTNLPTGPKKGIPYVVQLPPEYHHGRAFPVLFALHHGGETPKAMLDRVSELAAQHGYIVVAPEWDPIGVGEYKFSAEEHAAVTDVLRDLRRRFQIDSDRVFLMGVGEGGAMAFDVGLSHPDLFAGVLPVAGCPGRHGERYWPNCLHLPFYVVDGDLSGLGKRNLAQVEKWVTLGYPVLYVKYKGRGIEWFSGELPSMFDWMNHKKDRNKRATAVPELAKMGGTLRQEFQTLRSTDNRFYWLSTNEIRPGHVNEGTQWNNGVYGATFQGRILEGNLINLNPTNLKQITVWLSKEMIDFSKPVTVRVNGSPRWQYRKVQPSLTTLLEDFYQRGDRQRLFWAKLDFGL